MDYSLTLANIRSWISEKKFATNMIVKSKCVAVCFAFTLRIALTLDNDMKRKIPYLLLFYRSSEDGDMPKILKAKK